MSAEMDRLEVAVRRNITVGAGFITYAKGLAQQVRDSAGDRAKSIALADEIEKDSTDMEAALLENTPTPPAEPPPA